MDSKILHELKRLVGAQNVTAAPEDMVCYSYDGTIVEWKPEVVVTPTSSAMVSAVVSLANERRLPIVPRGAGTGLSGGSVPRNGGIALSMTRMNRILEIDTENLVAVAQPGVITADLQAEVEQRGLFYPPDPSSRSVSTLGGNVAENAGGPRGLKYGVTSDYVMGLEVVVASGQILRLGGKTVKNVTGYNLVPLIVGSEGTLGVITEITLRLIPKPKAQRTLLAVFPNLDDAGRSVTSILLAGVIPATIELMDRTTIRSVETYLHIGLPTEAEALLLIDVDGEESTVAAQAAEVATLCRSSGASEVRVAGNAEQSEQLWQARRAVSPSLARVRPTKLGEDIVVPRSQIPAMIRRLREISQEHNLPIATFGHAGDGNLHPNILFDRKEAEEVERVEKAAGAILAAAVQLGGTLSGEHGIGLSKKGYLAIALQPETLSLMRQIKEVFDPHHIMNPGKIFPESD